MFGTHVLFTSICVAALIFGNMAIYELGNRIYPNGNTQDLVTTCEVDSKISNSLTQYAALEKTEVGDGYFIDIETGFKIEANIINEDTRMIRVQYNRPYTHKPDQFTDIKEHWIEKDRFIYYYSYKVMNSKIRELEAKLSKKKGK